MKPFSTVAIPHRDNGRLTLDVFAANLWHVYREFVPGPALDERVVGYLAGGAGYISTRYYNERYTTRIIVDHDPHSLHHEHLPHLL